MVVGALKRVLNNQTRSVEAVKRGGYRTSKGGFSNHL